MNIRTTFSVIILIFCRLIFAQTIEDFEDDDLFQPILWQGDLDRFVLSDDGRLQLQASEAGTSSLASSFPEWENQVWQASIKLGFNPSSLNYANVFFAADAKNPNEIQQGIKLQIGSLDDDLKLFWIREGRDSLLIDGEDDMLNHASNELTIRLTQQGNLLVLEADLGDGFLPFGNEQIGDTALGNVFAWQCTYTSTRADKFWIDDVLTDHFRVNQLEVLSDSVLLLVANQNVEWLDFVESDFAMEGYQLNFNRRDADRLWIDVSPKLGDGDYALLVNERLTTAEAQQVDFTIKELPENPAEVKILINEIMADPTPVVGLPDAEYVELWNRSGDTVNLDGFRLNGVLLPQLLLPDDAYLIVCDEEDATAFEEVYYLLAVSGFDALTNSGDSVVLRDDAGNVLDEVHYELWWYADSQKDDGGFSLERINPDLVCRGGFNWRASASIDGGTPGVENAVLDFSADTADVFIRSFEIADPKQLEVRFSEPVDTLSLQVSLAGDGHFSLNWQNEEQLTLLLADELISEQADTIVFDQVKDCAGNETTLTVPIAYDVTAPKLERWILLSANEVALIFHEPLQETIAEREANYVFGKELVSHAILQDTADDRVHLTLGAELKSEEQLRFRNLEDLSDNIAEETAIDLVFRSDWDTAICSSAHTMQLQFSEALALEQPFASVTFSRMGKPKSIILDEENSKVVWLEWSEAFAENDTLWLYAEGFRAASGALLQTPALPVYYDTRPPKVDSLVVIDDQVLRLYWSEKVDEVTAGAYDNYSLEGTYPDRVDVSGAVADLYFEEGIAQEEWLELSHKDIEDLSGNTYTTRRYYDVLNDRIAPKLLKAVKYDAQHLRIDFHEAIANGEVLVGGNPVDSSWVWNTNELMLKVRELPENEHLEVSISGFEDLYGNVLADTSIFINTLNPAVVRVERLTDSLVWLRFSQPMNTNVIDTANWENALLSAELVEDQDLLLGIAEQDFWLLPENILDQQDRQLQEDSILIGETLIWESYAFQDHRTLILETNKIWEEESLDQITLDGVSPQELHQDGDELTLIFEENVSLDYWHQLQWAAPKTSEGEELPPLSLNLFRDAVPPVLLHMKHDFLGKLILRFDESLAKESFDVQHYELAGIGEPLEVDKYSEREIVLDFGEQIQSGMQYELTLKTVEDLYGNRLKDEVIAFEYQPPALATEGMLFISEIMVDPTPAVQLPEAEYLEIYNASGDSINLAGVLLIDPSVEVQLPEVWLSPKSFAVLCEAADTLLFETATVIGVERFPSLGNTRDSLALRNLAGEPIDRVVYSDTWYGDETKDDGGYSLERWQYQSSCFGQSNWAVSQAEEGGTPGRANSLTAISIYDFPPQVVGTEVLDAQTLMIMFDQSMDSLSLVAAGYNQALNLEKVEAVRPYFEAVKLHFSESMTVGELYSMNISGAMSCLGVEMEEAHQTFGLGKSPAWHELLISEIMIDPSPSVGLPESEYYELYNLTDQLLDLEGMKLTNGKDTAEIAQGTLAAGEYMIICAQADQEAFSTFGNTNAQQPWLSFPNASGNFLLLKQDGALLDWINYEKSWHDSEKQDGGYALELVSFDFPCLENQAWASSIDEKGGTPGKPSSQVIALSDQFAPQVQKAVLVDSVTAVVVFDEFILTTSVESWNASLVPAIDIASLQVNELKPHQLQIQFAEPFVVNEVYQLSIAGAEDCAGNVITEAVTVPLVRPDEAEPFDIVFNELLFNPRPGGVDFVECYNRSSKYLDVREWTFARMGEENDSLMQMVLLSEEPYLLSPKDFVVFTTDADLLQADYVQTVKEKVLEVGALPNLPDDAGTFVLLVDSVELDRISYDADMHARFLADEEGVSLERIDPDQLEDQSANWFSAAADKGFATPGAVNSQYKNAVINARFEAEPKVIAPPASGRGQEFTQIHYAFDRGGWFAQVRVHDFEGRVVRHLANGTSLGAEGAILWDGTDDSGQQLRYGYYLIMMEAYHEDGSTAQLTTRVAIGW